MCAPNAFTEPGNYLVKVGVRAMVGAQQVHQLQYACRTVQEGGRYKTGHSAQGERAAITSLYFRKVLHKGKVSHLITAQI